MIPDIVYQFIKQAKLSKKEKKQILDAAIKYYDNNDPDDPKHRWDHMLDVMDVAKKIRGRDLDKDEFGMIAFHDSGYKHPKGYAYSKSRHPMFGAKIFRKEGPKLGYSPEEVKRIAKVIAYHNHRPDYASSPLLKDDMQMLLFSADEGTPIDLKDDAKMYYVKGRNGVYKGVDPKSKDFIKQLVAKVKTFGNYSKLKRLKYYNDVYPGYLQSKYDFWQSPDLEKYYKELDKKDKKKEKKAEFDLPDLKTNPRNKITRLIKNLKWGVRVDGKPDSTDELLFTMDPKKKYEVIGDDDSDLASCVDLTNRVVKNMKDVGSLATMRSDSEIPHLTPLFKHKGKYYLRSGSHKFSDPYDSLDEIGDRWFTRPNKYPPPEYIDFYDLPAGETIDEKDLRKIINEVKKKSKKTYRKSYTDRPGYKKKEASVDISDIVNAYKEQYGFDLSHMKGKHSKKPRYNNGKIAKDIPVESYGGSWAKDNTIYLNPDMDTVAKYYGLDNTDDLRKTIVAHELAHEIYNKQATKEYIKKIVDEAKKKKFTTAYLKTVPEHKIDEETFCEYLANGLNKKAKAITFPESELASLIGKNKLYTTRVSKDYNKYKLGDTVKAPWGDKYTIDSEDIYDDILKHKFYDELTEEQKKELKKYKRMKLLGLNKKASKLYTYVDPDADLSLGILSARQAPEDVLLRRYPGRAKNKKELLKLMQERLDDKDRPSLIYALSEPIPDRATEKLRRFRDARKLVSYDTDDIKDLIKILKRNYRKPPSEVKDVERKKYIQWGRKPKDGGAFFYAPVYKLLTESGKISPEILKEE